MSTVSVKASDLKKCLEQIVPLVPKGTVYVPLGVNVHNNLLIITCLQGCVFQSHIPIGSSEIQSISIVYRDITTLLPSSGDVELEFAKNYLELTTSGVSVSFETSFGVVPEQEFVVYQYSDILNDDYVYNLRAMLGMNLDTIYKTVKSVNVYNKVSLLRFPNTMVQVRTSGFPFDCTIAPEHVKLLIRFKPTKVCKDGDTLTFLSPSAVLQLPCKENVDKNDMIELMTDLGEPVRLDVSGYLEKVRNLAKAMPKGECEIAVYENGLSTKLAMQNTEASVKLGDTRTEVLQVMHLPTQIWLAFLKAIGSNDMQILVGGGKLCLRNSTMIILTRVLL